MIRLRYASALPVLRTLIWNRKGAQSTLPIQPLPFGGACVIAYWEVTIDSAGDHGWAAFLLAKKHVLAWRWNVSTSSFFFFLQNGANCSAVTLASASAKTDLLLQRDNLVGRWAPLATTATMVVCTKAVAGAQSGDQRTQQVRGSSPVCALLAF